MKAGLISMLRKARDEEFKILWNLFDLLEDNVSPNWLMESGLSMQNVYFGTAWKCEWSPTDHCVYNRWRDTACDHCVFCDEPAERL